MTHTKNDLHYIHQIMKTVDQYLESLEAEEVKPAPTERLKSSHESYEKQIREISFSGYDRTEEGKDKLIALYKLAYADMKKDCYTLKRTVKEFKDKIDQLL